ncbi:hypothetical protein F0562_008222 [Nyssa sinensis]|uniref:Uncharacterized protein n=1 Tax=Nyssa sinensis TaxID=561372 RepID=A0A5J5A651_9ASTE|nr:hypothetical protein F0562_008222 [Nyssa sinensis]
MLSCSSRQVKFTMKRVRTTSRHSRFGSICDLPGYVIIDIVARLPLKAILNCSSVEIDGCGRYFKAKTFTPSFVSIKDVVKGEILKDKKQIV